MAMMNLECLGVCPDRRDQVDIVGNIVKNLAGELVAEHQIAICHCHVSANVESHTGRHPYQAH